MTENKEDGRYYICTETLMINDEYRKTHVSRGVQAEILPLFIQPISHFVIISK